MDLLRIQLILKGVITQKDWSAFQENIRFDFRQDSYFAESKDNEILKERIQMLDTVSQHIGKYFSAQWVQKNVLRQTDEEIEKIQKEIEDEKSDTSEEIEPDIDVSENEIDKII